MAHQVVVIDNGAGSCKVGFAGDSDPVKVMPNQIVRGKGAKGSFVGDLVENCDDIQALSFRRPFDRGYVVSWEAQKEIWDRAFRNLLKVKPKDCSLLITEPLFNLPSIQESMYEVLFEEYSFKSCAVVTAPFLSQYDWARQHPNSQLAKSRCALVVDAGFSFTHAVPFFDGFVINHAVRRINLGGKAITNYLKELVSYRQWNMMDETAIIEDVKEKLCFVSLDVQKDLEAARKKAPENPIVAEYVLPDGVRHKRGYVKNPKTAWKYVKRREATEEDTVQAETELAEARPPQGGDGLAGGTGAGPSGRNGPQVVGEKRKGGPGVVEDQVLTVINERFMVPEVLFNPLDIGVGQAGLAECIVRAVSACHEDLHALLYSNVLLTGGSTLFPGFKKRLEQELRPLVPDEFELGVHMPQDPITSAWRGGSKMGASSDFTNRAVTRHEYDEHGAAWVRRRFTS